MARPTKHYGKWRIRWVDEHRCRQSETFDTRDEAVFAQQKHELEAKEIKRGLRGSIQPNKTVGDICDYWLERRVPLKRSPKDDRSIIRRHIRPLLGDVRLRDLNVGHADLLRAERTYLDLKTVHNILTLLISMLNVAVDLGWLARVPRIHEPRIPLFSNGFSYLRTKEEVARFLRAAKTEGELPYAFYATAIYTGMRQGELAGLRAPRHVRRSGALPGQGCETRGPSGGVVLFGTQRLHRLQRVPELWWCRSAPPVRGRRL
jgi:hypothetical protein